MISLLGFVFIGCSRIMPAGFWMTYEKGCIANEFSDQGPWGGLRWIQWDAEGAKKFSEDQIIRFANDNGWQLISRTEMSAANMGSWKGSNGRMVFPLLFGERSLHNDDIPRHISEDSIILKFDSGWMREDPGTNEMTTAFGYILYSLDNRKFAVYHFWGNG